jgi:catechol 2,3-dioxygenase-like lactoylglutathione lyase family enzyme
MEPRISIITLGVADLERSVRFYRDGLGLPMQGDDSESDEPMSDDSLSIAFFLTRGTWLSLYPWEELAEDATIPAEGSGFRGFTLAHNVRSPEEADALLAQAQAAGAKLVKPAADTFWGGYSGYFADPDGHLWEVAWNPYFEIE